MMSAVLRLGVRRPKVVLGAWLLMVVGLGIAGIGVQDRLRPSNLVIPGTEIARWAELRADHFGDEATVILTGSPGAIDRLGPGIAERLSERDDTAVLSPWSGKQAEQQLRPSPERAVIVVDLGGDTGQAEAGETVGELQAYLEEAIPPSLAWHLTGLGPLGRDINVAVVESMETAEQLAAPALLIVLLIVFRTVVAAAIPLLIAGATTASSFGLVALLTRVFPLDAITLSLASLVGLALGVDYSLLLVTRFRDQLALGDPVRRAASTAAHTAGRTVFFAGIVLIAILTVSLVLSPGTVLLSAAVGAISSAALGVVGGALATPAILTLVGERVNRLAVGRSVTAAGVGRLESVAGRAIRRPGIATVLVLGLLLAGAAPALGIDSIPPDPLQLPENSDGLESYQQVRAAGLGPTVEVLVASPEGALTRQDHLERLARFERRLAAIPDVRLVLGPGLLAPGGDRPSSDASDEIDAVGRDLAKLDSGLRHADRGVKRLRGGLGEAADGGRLLEAGVGEAGSGSTRLAAGGGVAREGAERIASATGRADREIGTASDELVDARRKARRLRSGSERARTGSERLAKGNARVDRVIGERLLPGVRRLADGLRGGERALGALGEPAELAEREIGRTVRELDRMSVGKADAGYPDAVRAAQTALAAVTGRDPRDGSRVRPGYDGLPRSLELAADEADRGHRGAQQLARGTARLGDGTGALRDGSRRLANGLGRLDGGGKRIVSQVNRFSDAVERAEPKVGRLARGADTLVDGLGRLAGGNARLARGLADGESGLSELTAGLERGRDRGQPLEAGLGKISGRVAGLRDAVAGKPGAQSQSPLADFGRLNRRSPGFLDSGYVALAALDGARTADRESAGFLVDLDDGGSVGRIVVLPDVPTDDPRTVAVVDRATALAREFSANGDLEAAVGGAAPELVVYDRETSARLPWLIAATALITYLLLVPVLRSLFLPLVAVVLNMLTVAVGFGVLTVLFVGEEPLLGGAGALDVVSIAAIFSITFALSIDYQVFLLTRMREEFVRTQSNDAAILFGIRRTAAVVTGAAAIMVAVFCAFALSEFVVIRQFGIGLAVAVLIDATLVRLVLLPALMRLFGLSTWWLPTWLDDRLPVLDVEGSRFEAQQQGLARVASS